jgi:hypothetical protein
LPLLLLLLLLLRFLTLGLEEVLHLIVSEDDVLKGVDVGDALELLAIALHQVEHQRLDILLFDELEELQAGGVEEVVAWHGVVDDCEDRLEEAVLDNLPIVELVLEGDAGAEEFERGWRVRRKRSKLA